MERTPSPPRRARTPPAPLHGANYEPYSPRRRSSRVAAQREHQDHRLSSPKRSRTTRDVTPPATASKKSAAKASFALSPPSSPVSPHVHREPRSTRRTTAPAGSDSDHAALGLSSSRRRLAAMEGMLPTPAKTPRKRAVAEESIRSTARVLFHSRPATIEDSVPTPQKRKLKKNVFSLDSFNEQMEQEESNIQIYTDSKDRIPTDDDEADDGNPFITKKGKGKAKKPTTRKARKLDAETLEMENAVREGKGMIYTFRGKKIFRPYDDVQAGNASDEAPESSRARLRRQVGAEAHRPLTRSSVKPRLLFQEEIKRQRQTNGEEDEEEAVTDIELPLTPSRKTRSTVTSAETSHRRTRRDASFESWSRYKSVASNDSGESRKRVAEESLDGPSDKRARIR